MNLTRDRIRSLGWAVVLTGCLVLVVALTFRVNAVKSEVRLAERQIVSLRQERLFLETEFETRASQHQLRQLNSIEFGYEAPRAEQYLEGERQLAVLGMERPADAPAPIRVAMADRAGETSGLPAMVSPVTGKLLGGQALAAEVTAMAGKDGESSAAGSSGTASKPSAADLADRLARIDARAGKPGGTPRE